MSNDSTTSGYLTAVGNDPKYDEELEREITQWICGVSGLPAEQVLPLWVDPQPQIPENGVTCCRFGITSISQSLSQSDVQVSEAQSEQWTWEQITVICCFSGPLGASTAATFRAGIFVEQNNAELNRAGLSLTGAGTIDNLPERINNLWVKRYDLTVTLSRKNSRTYNIRTLKSASVQFFGE